MCTSQSLTSPLATAIMVAICSSMALPFSSSEITHAYLTKVEGTAMPQWCPLSNYTVPDLGADREGSLLSCSGACTRTQDCEFFCIIGDLCATFAAQVAPYFQGWTEDPHIVYDVCYTTWPGDPFNIVTPGLDLASSLYLSGSHPKFVIDGFSSSCKKAAPGFKGDLNKSPFLTIDFGTEKQVSVLKLVVIGVSTSADLLISLGNSPTYTLNPVIRSRPGEPTVDEEVFEFNPPESGQYLTFYRQPQNVAKLFLGEITAYEVLV